MRERNYEILKAFREGNHLVVKPFVEIETAPEYKSELYVYSFSQFYKTCVLRQNENGVYPLPADFKSYGKVLIVGDKSGLIRASMENFSNEEILTDEYRTSNRINVMDEIQQNMLESNIYSNIWDESIHWMNVACERNIAFRLMLHLRVIADNPNFFKIFLFRCFLDRNKMYQEDDAWERGYSVGSIVRFLRNFKLQAEIDVNDIVENDIYVRSKQMGYLQEIIEEWSSLDSTAKPTEEYCISEFKKFVSEITALYNNKYSVG